MPADSVDSILKQWKQARPDLDCSVMGVVGRLQRTSKIWETKLDRVFKDHGLSRIEFDILATIRRSNPAGITPTELYKTLMLSSGAVSTRLEQLVKEGAVQRLSSEHDRRSCKVILTAEGKALIDTALDAHVANMTHMLTRLTAQEQGQLADLLRKVLVHEENEPEQ
ncbi:MarR family winged helix-turn-helix transcriptional regulator [Celerinatantimonas diazotrophica]|uniref:DNA-binding MarR family transcriptional regulator n=1 Tax=Celerinatantimonas diazotrophica TaxID=412034 RepID=A0A4R1K4C9_9GAMM|nr:MarR family transcriptional regulator [Celerinatantimonas diazotrophica]TCK58777.1 DNA-binding MarR family transcriptional regulator [Celerinatantimonas diazotrophica]CAG9297408.1 hypothetical protein CEDIAZO_02589 [Celerinatantimonas diazotrophica]